MRRTTIYLEPELEVLVKLEAMRSHRSLAEIFREALRAYLARRPPQVPPGGGGFDSGETHTAEHAEEVLGELGFAEEPR
jgi:predicted transcriptional regulator